MLGYCQKDEGQPHYQFKNKGFTHQELAEGKQAYDSVSDTYVTGAAAPSPCPRAAHAAVVLTQRRAQAASRSPATTSRCSRGRFGTATSRASPCACRSVVC